MLKSTKHNKYELLYAFSIMVFSIHKNFGDKEFLQRKVLHLLHFTCNLHDFLVMNKETNISHNYSKSST